MPFPLKALFASMFLMTSASIAQNTDGYAKNRLVVKFKEPPSAAVPAKGDRATIQFGINTIDFLTAKYGCTTYKQLNTGKDAIANPVHILVFANDIDVLKAAAEFNATGNFVYAEPDYIATIGGEKGTAGFMPNDQYFNRQWGLKNDGSFPLSTAKAGADINMTEAWELEQGDSTVVVAIIDSGCKLDHPDFAGRIWTNKKEIPDNGIDDDHNGYVDDINGWDFISDWYDPSVDDIGHGTNVAGIIGANGNNTIGYAGVDLRCKLMICRALNEGSGAYTLITSAIHYAVDNGARVINMSLGGLNSSQLIEDAVNYAYKHNVVIVAAMGNNNNSAPEYPAAYAHVIAVGSTSSDDTRSAPFLGSSSTANNGSNFGSHISVVAPGNCIFGLDNKSNTNYDNFWCGTSQATPHVAGLISLLIAQDKTRTVDQLKAIIQNTADDEVGKPSEDTPGKDIYYGYGRINAKRALTPFPGNSFMNTGDITVFPNPSSGNISLSIPTEGAYKLLITDILGRNVYIKTVDGNANFLQFDLSTSPRGIYYISLLYEGQTIHKSLLLN